MATMKVAQVPRPGGPIELVEREVPQPGFGEVRVRVQACGICHSDTFTKEGHWPGLQYPRVPGHEIAGVVDEVGVGSSRLEEGPARRRGMVRRPLRPLPRLPAGRIHPLRNHARFPALTTTAAMRSTWWRPRMPWRCMPEGISAEEAAPLLCAGITTFNALRHSGAGPGDLVAIQGVGGLGHLGIQFANKFGYKVAAVSRGADNAALARKLGAHHYIDSQASNPAEELKKLGGARVILATAPSGKAMTALFDGLGTNGKMVVVGASMEPIQVTPIQLIMGRKEPSGLAFRHLGGFRGHAQFRRALPACGR